MLLLILAALSLTCQASNYAEMLADLQYLYNLERLEKSLPVADYYPDDTYGNKLQDDWDVAYPDSASYPDPAPKEARDYGEAALRDQEYMKQLPISGYQFISGGTGRQDPVDVKTDKVLPAYCTPPNPCPQGYTGTDNCLKDFENTPENNRRILEEQDCACDAEHMLSCPPGKKTIDPKSGLVDATNMGAMDSLDSIDLTDNSFLSASKKRQKIIKKSPHFIKKRATEEGYDGMYSPYFDEADANINPFMEGQLMDRVAKKQAPSYK